MFNMLSITFRRTKFGLVPDYFLNSPKVGYIWDTTDTKIQYSAIVIHKAVRI